MSKTKNIITEEVNVPNKTNQTMKFYMRLSNNSVLQEKSTLSL